MVKKKYVQARLDPDLYKKLQFYCVANDKSIQEIIETLIRDLLQEEEKST